MVTSYFFFFCSCCTQFHLNACGQHYSGRKAGSVLGNPQQCSFTDRLYCLQGESLQVHCTVIATLTNEATEAPLVILSCTGNVDYKQVTLTEECT